MFTMERLQLSNFTPLFLKLYLFYLFTSAAFLPKIQRAPNAGETNLIFSSYNLEGFIKSLTIAALRIPVGIQQTDQRTTFSARRLCTVSRVLCVYLSHQYVFVISLPLLMQNFPFYVIQTLIFKIIVHYNIVSTQLSIKCTTY